MVGHDDQRAPLHYSCRTVTAAPTEMNPMQQAVVDALGKSPDWSPLPRNVVEDVRTHLNEQLADIAARFSKEDPLWVSKRLLTTIHGCEAHHVASKNSFEWTPAVSESSARYEMFGGAIVLGTKADLTLGTADQKVIIDVKSGGLHASHREDLRFYALVEALRSGMAPRRLATYSLAAARADVEDVSEGVLQAAVRRVVHGVRTIVAVELDGREPTKRPAVHCRWCPLRESCVEGAAFLSREPLDEDDEI
ncbi:MAG: hypothetical protein EB111_00820 [Actinobacteria bacterium]|nr:hypothetical protein [Actinomycetota bacterium]